MRSKPVFAAVLGKGRVRIYYDGELSRRFWLALMAMMGSMAARYVAHHSLSINGVRIEADDDADWEAVKRAFAKIPEGPEASALEEAMEAAKTKRADKAESP